MPRKELKVEDVHKNIIYSFMYINSAHPELPRNARWYAQVSFIIFVNICNFYILGYAVVIVNIPEKDYVEALKNGFMFMINASSTYKYFLLLAYRRSVAKLLKMMEKDYADAMKLPDEEFNIVLKFIKDSHTACQIWLAMTLAIGPLYPLKSIILMAYSYHQGQFQFYAVFPLTLAPFLQKFNFAFVFTTQYIIQLLFDFYACVLYVAFEPLVPVLILHACGKLDLVKTRLLRIYSDAENQEVIDKRFRGTVVILQDVYDFVNEINGMVNLLYEMSLKVNTVSIPCVFIKLIEGYSNREINLEFLSSFIGLFLLILSPSYYSEKLIEKSEEVRQAMFSCGWECQFDLKNRTALKFMIARAARPPIIKRIFGVMSLDTFANMCHNSYAIFNLMNVGM